MIDKGVLEKEILSWDDFTPEIKEEIKKILRSSRGKKLSKVEEERVRAFLRLERRLQEIKLVFWSGLSRCFDNFFKELKEIDAVDIDRIFAASDRRVDDRFRQFREKLSLPSLEKELGFKMPPPPQGVDKEQ